MAHLLAVLRRVAFLLMSPAAALAASPPKMIFPSSVAFGLFAARFQRRARRTATKFKVNGTTSTVLHLLDLILTQALPLKRGDKAQNNTFIAHLI